MSAIDNTTEINSEMSNNIISFPKQKKIENSEELLLKRERNRKIMAANAIVESMSRKFIYNIRHYDLDKKLTEEDEEWLENNINVMLSVVQCIAYSCIDEAHPLDKLEDNLASHLKEKED